MEEHEIFIENFKSAILWAKENVDPVSSSKSVEEWRVIKQALETALRMLRTNLFSESIGADQWIKEIAEIIIRCTE